MTPQDRRITLLLVQLRLVANHASDLSIKLINNRMMGQKKSPIGEETLAMWERWLEADRIYNGP